MTKDNLKEYQALVKEKDDLKTRIEKCKNTEGVKPSVLATLEELYYEKLAKVIQSTVKIEETIDALDSVERAVIRFRYIDGMDWYAVAEKVGYSWQQTHRIHAKALERLADL